MSPNKLYHFQANNYPNLTETLTPMLPVSHDISAVRDTNTNGRRETT